MRRSSMALVTILATVLASGPVAGAPLATLATYRVVGDGIPTALTGQPPDAARGRDIVSNRQIGMCMLCHQLASANDRFQGDIATNLAGVGARWTVPQLRLRLVDSRRVNAESVMPAYYKTGPFERTAATWRDKPILDAQQIEDVLAWLTTLK